MLQECAMFKRVISEAGVLATKTRGNVPTCDSYILSTNNFKVSCPQPSGTIAIPGSLPYHRMTSLTQYKPAISSVTNLHGELFTKQHTSPHLKNAPMPVVTLPFPHSFSWVTTLNWNWIKNLMDNTGALIRHPEFLPEEFKAVTYQARAASTICVRSDAVTNFAQFMVSALLNNIQPASDLHLKDIHSWLGRLPQSVILGFLKALPIGHSDVLRERLFVTAMDRNDVATIHSVLETGFDLHQNISWGSYGIPMLPLHQALLLHDYPIAKVIVQKLACVRSADHVLAQITDFSGYQNGSGTLLECDSFFPSLVRMMIDAGAKPTIMCVSAVLAADTELVRHLLENVEEGVQGCLQAGVLINFLEGNSRPTPCTAMVFSFILQEKLEEIQKHNPATSSALHEAFRLAIRCRCIWAMDMIISATFHLRIGLNSPTPDDITDTSISSAYRDLNWNLLELLTHETKDENDNPIEEELSDAEGLSQWPPKEHEILANGSLVPEWDKLLCRLNNYRLCHESTAKPEIVHLLAGGCPPDFDNILAALTWRLHRARSLSRDSVIGLLARARTTAISQMVFLREDWNHALMCVHRQHDCTLLDDLYHRQYTRSFLFNSEDTSWPDKRLELRILAYHAIDTNNDMLWRWLFQTGIFTGKIAENARHRHGRQITLPSLLAIAASQSNTHLIRVLLEEGAEIQDSDALMWAVAANSDNAIIEMLLAAVGDVQCKKKYGGAALRMAIRRQNYDMLRKLSKVVDVNSLEPFVFESRDGVIEDLPPLSPMGEAIMCRDLKAATILIEHRATVGGLVAQYDYEKYNNSIVTSDPENWKARRGTVMKRATTLLAAIDTGNLLMVKLLVDNGANINGSFDLGLVRTPLQRAAEIGNFEIVQYLLENGAHANSAPCYSGGTPLQLTAIEGHVGIAELLLEYGADVNYPPAKGHGRTAFEGAAERARVDMMSLLVSRGLDFDLVVEKAEENHEDYTQYQRAMRFAKEIGHPASARFVQRLREESAVDVINWSAVGG
jgi:ankyrin repeat protein